MKPLILVLVLMFGCTGSNDQTADENQNPDKTGTSHDKQLPRQDNSDEAPKNGDLEIIQLPESRLTGDVSLEETLALRESVREYSSDPLSQEEISQLLFSAQGITHGSNKKTAPSAGATYPIEVYLATKEHFYHYVPDGHRVEVLFEKNAIASLQDIAQSFIQEAPAVFIITAVYSRTEERYGDRAERYVILEAGHVCQNILLQAVALNLGAVAVGAFDDEAVSSSLGLPENHDPLYLVPVGHLR